MDENEFELDGVAYVAGSNKKGVCYGCAFFNGLIKPRCLESGVVPECAGDFRVDGQDVIFVEKPQ